MRRMTHAYPSHYLYWMLALLGAHKRFSKLFASAGYETVICTKVRDGDRRIVKVKEGTCTGKHVVIGMDVFIFDKSCPSIVFVHDFR